MAKPKARPRYPGPPKLRPSLLWGTPSHALFQLGTAPQQHPWDVTPPRQGMNTPQLSPPLRQHPSRRGSAPEQGVTPSSHHHSWDPTHRAPPEQGISPPPSQPPSAHPGQDVTPHSEDLLSNSTLRLGMPQARMRPSQLGRSPPKAPWTGDPPSAGCNLLPLDPCPASQGSPTTPQAGWDPLPPHSWDSPFPTAPWVRAFPAPWAGGVSPTAPPARRSLCQDTTPESWPALCIPRELQNTAGQDGTPPFSAHSGPFLHNPTAPGRGLPAARQDEVRIPPHHPGQGIPPTWAG